MSTRRRLDAGRPARRGHVLVHGDVGDPAAVQSFVDQAAAGAGRGAEIRAQSPLNQVARAEEIAVAVLYLTSPQAEWASGAVLDLNGASYLH